MFFWCHCLFFLPSELFSTSPKRKFLRVRQLTQFFVLCVVILSISVFSDGDGDDGDGDDGDGEWPNWIKNLFKIYVIPIVQKQ